ncbi:MAG: hypothetical protein ACON5B_12230, partial [Myxococcota bacterium]
MMSHRTTLYHLLAVVSMFAAALSFPSAAWAQNLSFLEHDQWMIEPQPGTFYENGVGAPSVAFDEANNQWVMYFETRFPEPTDTCIGVGQWGIGRATSPDGLSWTVDDEPVITNQLGSYYGCVVAHPNVLFDGKTWRMWFKAHQENGPCDDPKNPSPWGCSPVTGVGYAESTDGIDWTVTTDPVINLGNFGFPAVTRVDDVYYMLLAYSSSANGIFEIWEAVSTDDGVTWSPPTTVLEPNTVLWAPDELYNPAVTCQNHPNFPFILMTGGRDTTPAGGSTTLLTAALGRAFSANGVQWPWDGTVPIYEWDLSGPVPDNDWRHWDVVLLEGSKLGAFEFQDNEYLLYYAQRNEEGRNRVGLAYTYDTIQTG